MILPVCYKPEQDELLYGWILGLARANGLDGHNPSYSFINFFMKEKLPTTITEGNAVKLDYLSNMEMVCERYKDIPCFPELETIIRNMTPLYTLFPLLPVGLQVKRSQYLLRERSGGMLEISHRMEDINELKVCPDCMREDRERIGEAYYHTWHQLPEVCVCAKHHKPLMRITVRKKPYLDIENVLKSMEEVELCAPLEVEIKIAEFMKAMYEDPVNIELNMTQSILLERMADKGYPLKMPYGSMADDLRKCGYGELFGQNIDKRISIALTRYQAPLNGIIWLLSCLFGTYGKFREKAKAYENDWKKEFLDAVQGRYEVLSDFGQTVLLRCLKCGNEFHLHPYAVFMGIGCPECDKKLPEEIVINRMLACVGDGQYELTESESGEKSSVLHRTCGRVRDQKIQKIIYEGTECICGRLVTKEILQERIDPERKEFIILRYERRKHEITVEHTVCGKKFQIDLPRFEKNPFCRCCRPKKHSEEKFAETIRQLTGDAYEVTVPFRGQNEKVELRHKECGTTTRGLPVEFLHGRRCDLCTPLYSKEIVEQALEDATKGKYQLMDRVDNFLQIRMPDGEVKKKTASYIMQELIRPTPSELFTERAKVIPEFISAKGKLFAEIRERSEKYGVWFLEDRKEDGKERGVLKGYLHKLLVQGYIFLKDKGVYSVYENVEDRVVIEQRFVHHGEQVIGAWHGESLAYRCGIINEKPVAEYVLSNRQNAPQWVKIRIGDTDVFKMKPPVPVTKENETLMNAINLLAYVSEHPEYKEKVLRYLDEQGIGVEKILESDILKKSTRRIQRYISDVFTKKQK